MTGLESSLLPVSLKTTRRTLRGGLSLKIAQKWTYEVEFQHETKDGSRPFGAGLYTINSSQFPVPVDFTTNRLESGLQYSGSKGQWRLSFSGSRFENGASSVTWENPFSSAPENQLLRAALEPDNTFYQLSLQGAFSPRPGLRFSGRAALGRMRQDEPLLPYTINPAFSDLALPHATADQRIDTGTLNISGKITARLASRLDVSASGKLDRRDNESPVDAYTIIITDFLPGGERFNRPYGFDRKNYDLELRYRAAGGVNLRAGSEWETYQRTLQSVFETKERLNWGEVSFSGWSAGQLRVQLEDSRRDASPYRQVDTTGLIENPLMRKFNYADRDRKRVVTEMDIASGQPWSLNLSWSRSEDEYSQSAAGLSRSREKSFALDFGLYLGSNFSLNSYMSREVITSALSGFDASAESPWDASTRDRVTTLGIGVMAKPSKRLTLELNWVQSKSRGRIAVAATPQFPVLHSRLGNLRSSVSLIMNENWILKFLAEHERLSTKDWQTDGFGPGSIANVLTLGGLSPRYHVTALSLQALCRF
jgi:MtrB/PioB family decaheme-associated outer membrane protein